MPEEQPLDDHPLSLKKCAVCNHYRAYHGELGCSRDPVGNRSRDAGILSTPALKKMGALCWCPAFIADFSQAADLIHRLGSSDALKHGTAEAIRRGDLHNAHRLWDQFIIKTPPDARDSDWVRATERSIARLESDATAGHADVSQAISPSPGHFDPRTIEPLNRAFRWEDLDHQLIDRKLSTFCVQMQAALAADEKLIHHESVKRGNAAYFIPAFFEMQTKRAEEWARKVYEIYCEVWRLQGRSKTLDFVRAVCQKAVDPLLSTRQGTAESQMELHSMRTRSIHEPQFNAAIGAWRRGLAGLRASLLREFEIQALECNYAIAPQQPVASIHASRTRAAKGKASDPDAFESVPAQNAHREAVIRKVQNPQAHMVLSTPETADYFSVAPRTVHRWLEQGRLRNGARRGSVTIESIRQWEKKRSRKRPSV